MEKVKKKKGGGFGGTAKQRDFNMNQRHLIAKNHENSFRISQATRTLHNSTHFISCIYFSSKFQITKEDAVKMGIK